MNSSEVLVKKKAVIYCRVSSKEQVDEGNSLVSQERICKEYALREGYEIAEIFIEKGQSAKTAERPELKRMLSMCKEKKNGIQAMIAYKVDRISRNIADYSMLRLTLKRYGIEIKSVTEFFEDTPAGRFMENIIANVGQFDNDVRAERCIGGMREAATEGRYVWMAPVGYDNKKVNGKSTIVPNNMAPLMKEAFERVAMRIEPTEVVRVVMSERGLVGKRGGHITRSHFYRLLRNPLYKGTIKKFGTTFPGTFDPIVSPELFEDVQAVLLGRKNKFKYYKKDNPDFPLRRFVVNEHGKQLTGYWSKGKYKKYPYYSFSTPGSTIRKEALEQKFKEFLSRYTFETEHLKYMKECLVKQFGRHADKQENDKSSIEARIAEVNKQIDNLIKLQAMGNISDNIFKDRVSSFDSELDDLKQLLKAKSNDNVNISELMKFATRMLKEPYKLWVKCSIELKRKLQVFEFPQGVVFDGENFRTPKICSLFKLKEIIDDHLWPRADSRDGGKNTHTPHLLLHSDIDELETKEFWEHIVQDIKQLKRLINTEIAETEFSESVY